MLKLNNCEHDNCSDRQNLVSEKKFLPRLGFKLNKCLLIQIIALLLLATMAALSKDLNNKIYTKLKNKYSGISSISFRFSNENTPSLNGSIFAQKGNKYLLDLSSRIITSNGQTIWNYSVAEDKVIISNYERLNSNSISIENIFFSFIDDFSPVEIKEVSSSSSGSMYKLILQADKKSGQFINELILFADKSNLTIKKVMLDNGNGMETWIINSLKINPSIANSLFEGKYPKSAQVLDLRM